MQAQATQAAPGQVQVQAAQAAPGSWHPYARQRLLQAGQLLRPVLQQLLALGVAAPAQSAPVTQVASLAPGGGEEARGLKGMLDPTEAIVRIHSKVDGTASGPIYKGTSPEELCVHNNPVLDQKKLPKILSTTDGGD